MNQDLRRQTYERWVRDYATDVYRCAVRLCGRTDVAEDLVQESYYEAWRSMSSLREPEKSRPWLLSILRHRYAHWVRDEARSPRSTAEFERAAGELPSDEVNAGERLATRDSLQAALDTLHDRFKIPFLLVFLDGMTCEEAAGELKIPLGTVLSRLHRARRFLRGELQRQDNKMRPPLRLHREESPPPSAGLGGAS